MFIFTVAMWIAYILVLIYVVQLLGRFVRAVESIAKSLEKPTPIEQEQKQ